MSALLLLPLLADLPEDNKLAIKTLAHSGPSQMMIIFGAIGVVAVLSFLVVYFFRSRFIGRKRRHHHHQSAPSAETSTDEGGKGRKKGRRRRSQPPLNPTLAQTHGLPPMRGEGQPPPPAP